MSLLVVTTDLVVQTWIAGAAQRAGQKVTVAATIDAVRQSVVERPPTRILVDLDTGIDAAAICELARAMEPSPAVLAFGPHVHKDRLAAARAAGCQALSRGQLHAEIDAILQSPPAPRND